METLAKIAPFMRKAGVVVVGRERLLQLRNRLAYVLITNDISENTRQMVVETFKCPVYQCLTSEDIEKLFNYKGTKLLGFRRSPMSNAVLADIRPFIVKKEATK